jgi:hypothetical protein
MVVMDESKDYITSVLNQINAGVGNDSLVLEGAFLAAALAIIDQLESPMREEAFVRLATLARDRDAVPKGYRKVA